MLSAAVRDDLILDHLPQVHLLAQRLHASLNRRVDIEDLVSAGIIGLIAAVDRFDPSLGNKLKTFAEHKIRGAMLDSIAKLDGRQRGQSRMYRAIDAATRMVEQRNKRAAAPEEVADEMGLPLPEFLKRVDACAPVGFVGLPFDCDTSSEDRIIDAAPSPEREAEHAELCRLLDSAIDSLEPHEKELLNLFYRDGLPIADIGERTGEPEWRLTKIKRQALAHVRERLNLKPLTAPVS